MQITISKTGYVVNVTHTIHGMLEQGGFCGRKVLVRFSSMDFKPEDLDAKRNDYGTTNREYLIHYVRETGWTGDRMLRKGEIVR